MNAIFDQCRMNWGASFIHDVGVIYTEDVYNAFLGSLSSICGRWAENHKWPVIAFAVCESTAFQSVVNHGFVLVTFKEALTEQILPWRVEAVTALKYTLDSWNEKGQFHARSNNYVAHLVTWFVTLRPLEIRDL